MTSTSTHRKSSIKHMAVNVEVGTALPDAIKDCIVAAIQTNLDVVVLSHEGASYIVHLPALVKMVSKQSPLVTGAHNV